VTVHETDRLAHKSTLDSDFTSVGLQFAPSVSQLSILIFIITITTAGN